MAKIRLNVSIAGNDFAWSRGQEVEVDDALAEALCSSVEGGEARAVRVDKKPQTRRATKPKPETRGNA